MIVVTITTERAATSATQAANVLVRRRPRQNVELKSRASLITFKTRPLHVLVYGPEYNNERDHCDRYTERGIDP